MTAAAELVKKPVNGARTPARIVRVVEDDSALSYLMDTARFEHVYRIAKLMASGSLTPAHLKGKNADEAAANCFRIANQALRWGIDPFAMMDATYVVNGKLGYEGKLVAAVINARAGLKGRLKYTHTGQGPDRTVTVIGTFDGDDEPCEIELSVKQAITKNEIWIKDPDQKLCYSGATKWARRHCPEILLGVLTDEDLERMAQHREPIIVDGGQSFATKSDELAARLGSGSESTTSASSETSESNQSEATHDDTGNASGLESGEGSQTTREPGDDDQTALPPGNQLSATGADLNRKIDDATGNYDKLCSILGDVVAVYKAKTSCVDPEGIFLYGKIDDLIAQAKPKKK